MTATMTPPDRRRADGPRYPFAPIAEALGETENQALHRLGISGTTAKQYRRDGMTAGVADRLACRVGRNPEELWPGWVHDTSPLTRPPVPRSADADHPSAMRVELTCPTCGANVAQVAAGRPTDGGRRIAAVLECTGPVPHRWQLTVALTVV